MAGKIKRAISIRQPYVELILQGRKPMEFRSRRTHIRERVYLYASNTPKDDPRSWRKSGAEEGSLPTGSIVGSVEIIDCIPVQDYFGYVLINPKRLRRTRTAVNQPQPGFWRPQF